MDGKGQTIALVEAYDDPQIDQAVDTFDNQFGLTLSGPSLLDQYGPASSFVTVINQNGQTAPLPGTDPAGAGTDNWEVEEAVDVEWVHALAPGAQIVVVESNSPEPGRFDGRRGHRRQPTRRLGGVHELGLWGRPNRSPKR